MNSRTGWCAASKSEPTARMTSRSVKMPVRASPRADVLRAWAGLGYNRRAVAVHRASRMIEREHAGLVPDDVSALRALPGVGPYTAAAVASIAFGRPVAAIDTNVRRVISRAA